MKNRILLFFFVTFFSALYAGVLADNGKMQSYLDASSKAHFLKHADQQGQPEIYSVSDAQDTDEVEKVKFDYSIITQQWLNFFFADYSYNTKAVTVQKGVYVMAPRYILYHSLQIAGC